MPVNLISSGGGTTTLTTAASASNFTVTIPASTGTMLTTASSIARSQLPAGSVLQVVQSSTSTRVTTTSTSFTDTNLSATITPSSASSKILVIATFSVGNSNGGYATYTQMVRSSTAIGQRTSYPGSSGNSDFMAITGGLTILDEPATTSATTYKIQYRSDNAGGAATFSGPNNQSYSSGTATNQSSLVLMEIAG
jgi:hypothetical protein